MTSTVACTLTAHDLSAQAQRWRALGERAGLERVTTDDGIRITFRDDHSIERELRALVEVENGCCSWASWEVVREYGSLAMRARSSGNGVSVLHGMFAGVVD